MLFYGVAGIFQAVFLPGAILFRMLKKDFRISEFIAFSFGLSLIFNYLLVQILTTFGIYNQSVLMSLFAAEVLLAVFVFRNGTDYSHLSLAKTPENNFFLALFAASIAYSLSQVGEVFVGWDAVVSWNRWALDWANGQYPSMTWNYPQLLPCVWSIPYVMMQNTWVQFFPFMIGLCFPPIIIVLLYYLKKSTPIYTTTSIVAATVLTVSFCVVRDLMWKIVGYADFPVAVIGSFSVVCLLIAISPNIAKDEAKFHLALGALFTAASAVTKQAGIFVCIFYILAIFFYRRNGMLQEGLFSRKVKLVLLFSFMIPILWYIPNLYLISAGLNTSEVSTVMGSIHEGRTFLQRLTLAMVKYPYIFAFAVLSIPSIFIKRYSLFAVAGIIYLILWGALLSYDLRNFSVGILLLAISFGGLVEHFKNKAMNIANLFIANTTRAFCVATPLMFAVLVSFSYFNIISDEKLVSHAERKIISTAGDPRLNPIVISAFNTYGSGYILTDYQIIGFLPGIDKEYYKLVFFRESYDEQQRVDVKDYFEKYKISYILAPSGAVEFIIDAINEVDPEAKFEPISKILAYAKEFSLLKRCF